MFRLMLRCMIDVLTPGWIPAYPRMWLFLCMGFAHVGPFLRRPRHSGEHLPAICTRSRVALQVALGSSVVAEVL